MLTRSLLAASLALVAVACSNAGGDDGASSEAAATAGAAAPAVHAGPATCAEGEDLFLSCQMAGSNNWLSVCGGGDLTSSESQGYVQYRFGSALHQADIGLPGDGVREDFRSRTTFTRGQGK